MRVCSAALAMPKSASFVIQVSCGLQQVARLDVAVDDAGAVGVVEPVAGVADRAHGLPDVELAALAQEVGAGGPVDVLHDDVVAAAVRVLAGVEDLHDVRVLEARGRERLAAEARDEGLVVGEVLGEQLHGHRAARGPRRSP